MDLTELLSPDKLLLLLLLLGPTHPPLDACPPIIPLLSSTANLASSSPLPAGPGCRSSPSCPSVSHTHLPPTPAGRSGDMPMQLLPYQAVISRPPVLYWFSLTNTISDFNVTKCPHLLLSLKHSLLTPTSLVQQQGLHPHFLNQPQPSHCLLCSISSLHLPTPGPASGCLPSLAPQFWI